MTPEDSSNSIYSSADPKRIFRGFGQNWRQSVQRLRTSKNGGTLDGWQRSRFGLQNKKLRNALDCSVNLVDNISTGRSKQAVLVANWPTIDAQI
jgi:hypothetical protein